MVLKESNPANAVGKSTAQLVKDVQLEVPHALSARKKATLEHSVSLSKFQKQQPKTLTWTLSFWEP